MPATTSCTPCCVETQTTNVPGIEGDPGTDGTDGTDGVNAYTVTTQDFTVPAVDANVAIFVEDTAWMVVGQPIFIEGPATFQVASIVSATQFSGTFLGAIGDVEPGATISDGAGVSPGGMPASASTQQVFASGTAYALTTTPAALDFGTTDPTLTLSGVGVYLLFARVRYDYTGATFAAVRTVTTKIRRTNNTAADVSNSSVGWKTDIITTLTYTALIQTIGPIPYTTSSSGDILTIFADVSVLPSAGTLDAVEASLVAVKIQ